MNGLDLAGLRRVLLAAAAAALAALVWALITWWLPVLAIVGAAWVLALLLRHGDRLTVAWWPQRQQAQLGEGAPASTTGQQAPAGPEMAKRDQWLL